MFSSYLFRHNTQNITFIVAPYERYIKERHPIRRLRATPGTCVRLRMVQHYVLCRYATIQCIIHNSEYIIHN